MRFGLLVLAMVAALGLGASGGEGEVGSIDGAVADDMVTFGPSVREAEKVEAVTRVERASPPFRMLRNDRIGYSLSYPRGWKITGRVVTTEFAAGAGCEGVRVVDFAPPADAGPGADVRQSFVQLCWKRAADGSSLDEFMRRTYGGRLPALFEGTRLGGVSAYRTQDGGRSRTFFLQTTTYRIQIVATVVAEPGKRALRLGQVNRILASFALTP